MSVDDPLVLHGPCKKWLVNLTLIIFQISTKSDVWSLGCILYYLVYSCTPFEHIRNQLMKLQAIISPRHKIEFPPTKMAHAVEVIKVNCYCVESEFFLYLI